MFGLNKYSGFYVIEVRYGASALLPGRGCWMCETERVSKAAEEAARTEAGVTGNLGPSEVAGERLPVLAAENTGRLLYHATAWCQQ